MTSTVQLCAQSFRVPILTDPVLQVSLMIVYVYIISLLIFSCCGWRSEAHSISSDD